MKLVTLEEYSGMNQPSFPASIIFCIHLGCDMTEYQSFSFLLVDFVLPFYAPPSSATTK